MSSKASAGASKAKKAVTKAAVGLDAKSKAKGLLGRVTGKTAAPKLTTGNDAPIGLSAEEMGLGWL